LEKTGREIISTGRQSSYRKLDISQLMPVRQALNSVALSGSTSEKVGNIFFKEQGEKERNKEVCTNAVLGLQLFHEIDSKLLYKKESEEGEDSQFQSLRKKKPRENRGI